MTKIVLFAAALCVASGCKKTSNNEKPAEPPKGSAETGSASASGSGSAAATGSAGSGSAVAAAAPWDGKSRLELPGFQTPESAYYDADQDLYFVSNINGKPLE